MTAGAVRVDLSRDPWLGDSSHDRHSLAVLERVPSGARVIVEIGSRRHVSQDAAYCLHEHDHRLALEIIGTDPDGVLAFVRAARDGEWRVVA